MTPQDMISVVDSWKEHPASRQTQRHFLMARAADFVHSATNLTRAQRRSVARDLAKRMHKRLNDERTA